MRVSVDPIADTAVGDVVAQLYRESTVDGAVTKLFRCTQLGGNVMGEHDFCFGVALLNRLFNESEAPLVFAVEIVGSQTMSAVPDAVEVTHIALS